MYCAASRERPEADVVVAPDEVSAEGVCGDVRCEADAEGVHASMEVACVQCRYAVKVKEEVCRRAAVRKTQLSQVSRVCWAEIELETPE